MSHTCSLTAATTAGSPERANEDMFVASTGALVLLDGAGGPTSLSTRCEHGTPWYVRMLATHLHHLMTGHPEQQLDLLLAEAITEVAALHPDCDLTHPGTPSTTVLLLRPRSDQWDYLVLSDSTLLAQATDGHLFTISDQRINDVATAERTEMHRHPIGSAEHQRARITKVGQERTFKNVLGGHWVAAANPDVVEQALTGTFPALRRAALLSDGAERWLGFTGADGRAFLDEVAEQGPSNLIAAVRGFEDADPQGKKLPRPKTYDDATIVYLDNVAQAIR